MAVVLRPLGAKGGGRRPAATRGRRDATATAWRETRQPLSLAQPFQQLGIGQWAGVGLAHEEVAVVGDPAIDPVAQGFRDETGERENPPAAAKGAGEFDQGSAAGEDLAVGFAKQDHGAVIGGGVAGEAHFGSEFSLQGGKGNSGVLVESHDLADGF